MKMTDVADALERAADLYESEQIEWCQGSWNKETTRMVTVAGQLFEAYFEDGEGQLGLPDTSSRRVERVISMCASGALAKACGIPVTWVQEIEGNEFTTLSDDDRRSIYILAREAVLKTVRSQDPYLTNNIPQWNDHKARAKQEVIDVFKDTAKELRNGNQG